MHRFTHRAKQRAGDITKARAKKYIHKEWASSTIDRFIINFCFKSVQTGNRMEKGVCVKSPDRIETFLFSTMSRPILGHTQSPIQWVSQAFSLGVKWVGHKADQPPTYHEQMTHHNISLHFHQFNKLIRPCPPKFLNF